MSSSKDLRLAVVDIGSNAVRLQISKVSVENGYPTFKRLEYLRFPLRLGEDVFSYGAILSEKRDKFLKIMRISKLLFDLYDVNDSVLCATSAMREAKNSREICQKVEEELGLHIEVISGEKEAAVISQSIHHFIDKQCYMHIDVGGGSTEVNLYTNGQKVASRSFKLGAVRNMQVRESADWSLLKQWIKQEIQGFGSAKIIAIGTGGNINKLYDLAQTKKNNTVNILEIKRVKEQLSQMSYQDRIKYFQLNEDRADVIVPALSIYIRAMEAADIQDILVPKVGLREGMFALMYRKYQSVRTEDSFL